MATVDRLPHSPDSNSPDSNIDDGNEKIQKLFSLLIQSAQREVLDYQTSSRSSEEVNRLRRNLSNLPEFFQEMLIKEMPKEIVTTILIILNEEIQKIEFLTNHKTPNSESTLSAIHYLFQKYFYLEENRSEETKHQQEAFKNIILNRFRNNPQFIISEVYSNDKYKLSIIMSHLYSLLLIDQDFAMKILNLITIVIKPASGSCDITTDVVRGWITNDTFGHPDIDSGNKKKIEFFKFVQLFKNKIEVRE
jgi:hypothetical protein